MKHQQLIRRVLGLSIAAGLGMILAACGAAPTATPSPISATAPPVIDVAPTTEPPTPRPAQSTATGVAPAATASAIATPTEAPITPPASAAERPACTSPAALTPAQTEGPYYTPNSPERASLIESGMGGTKLILTGYVLTTDCQPIAKARLDFWQADDQGAYDNVGYRLRGQLFTDESGRYTLETILPGEYPGRPPHIHVKVQAPNGPVLTSQIYFPGMAANERDSIFDPALLADVQETADGKMATFNFVVR
jgi:protocatechuate 3,4-dioxygenase beta subunit